MSLPPHSKGAMHACAQSFKQTCTFASCFSIFLHFLTTTENISSVFPFPPHTARKTRAPIALCMARDKRLMTRRREIPAALLQHLREAAAPGSPGRESPEGWRRLPGRRRRCAGRCHRLVRVSPALEQPQRKCGAGISNWFQTPSHRRALYLAASQGSRFGITVG